MDDIMDDIRALQLQSSELRDEVYTASHMEEDVEPMKVHSEPKAHVEVKDQATTSEPVKTEVEKNNKRHLNVVFIGHVDYGKSTIGAQILYLSGQVDERTIQKNEKEAKDNGRESWCMAYIMDTNEEERAKGITVEVGRAEFETDTTRFTILDAPGHKSYVPNMISGASQADIGVLVISARKGEFESGFEGGGQTREHIQLAKTLGISKLLVVVNKMDDKTVNWSKKRYDEIESKMVPFLKFSGYNVKKDIQFSPISGLRGTNMKTRMDKKVCPWWDGQCLFEALDVIDVPPCDLNGPFRMPIFDTYKEMGTVVMGKVESGSVHVGDNLLIMPNKVRVKVVAIFYNKDKFESAGLGENLSIRITGIKEEDIRPGFVLCSIEKPIPVVNEFVAQMEILGLVDKAFLVAGYNATLHIHSVVENCEIMEFMQKINPKTGEPEIMELRQKINPKPGKPVNPMKMKVVSVKNGEVVICRIKVTNMICIEKFSDFQQLGRFSLRTDDNKTIAVGKVTDILA